ncbi:MAG: DUF1580 domain-containing protein, partial [Planctomycetota bacterium]
LPCLRVDSPLKPQGYAMLPISPGDKLLPVLDAVEQAIGYRPHPSTASRWRRRGLRGVKLACVLVGGRPRTTISAVLDFIRATQA